jgi:hypothetical protein
MHLASACARGAGSVVDAAKLLAHDAHPLAVKSVSSITLTSIEVADCVKVVKQPQLTPFMCTNDAHVPMSKAS